MGEKMGSSSPWESLILNEDKTRKAEYLESEKGQEERSIEDNFDQWAEDLDEMVSEGKISREEARKQQEEMLESAVKGIEAVRNEEYERQRREKLQALANALRARVDSQTAKPETKEEPPKPSEEKRELGAYSDTELDEELAELEAEEAKLVAELGDSELDDELAALEAEEAALVAELGDDEETAENSEAPKLVAISADFTHDKKELANDLAEIDLNEETSKAKFLKKLWKGTLFKKYFQKKYTREYIEGKRTQNIDGEDLTIDDIMGRRKESAIKRFIMGVVEEEDSYIHRKAGEDLVEADAETSAALKSIIEKFASAPESADEKDLKREFENDIERFKAEIRDKGRPVDNFTFDNYLEVAQEARACVLHKMALSRVMEGFKLYNAEVRDGVRTEAHRDNLDKIINKLESSAIGQFIPAEVLAGAVSITSALTQTGARAAFGVAGGMVASSVIAGLKERNRVTEDRARLLRDIANGMNYDNSGKTSADKYEARIFGTCYTIEKARDLATGIEYAMGTEGEGRTDAVLKAVAEARVRIDLSDESGKDLISYSSENSRGKERLNLDIALIRAEKSLSEADRVKLEELKKQIQKKIAEDIDEKDKDFKKIRARKALKKSGITLATGLATFFVSQEIMAAIDPGKIGILEKAGLLKTSNNKDASETLLASSFGFNRGTYTSEPEVVNKVQLRADQEAEIDRLGAGYTRTTIEEAWTETPDTPNSFDDISPSTFAGRLRVKYDGWANNGTAAADGNELRAYLTDGQMVSGMRGISTMGNQSFNYDELAAAGRIKGYLTIGGTRFELASTVNEAGQLTWGENGVFTTTAGETIKALGDNGEKLYKYFEIAMDNGIDADGVQHIIPFATDVGRDTFDGMIQKAVTVPIEHPAVYEFTKTITHEVSRTVTGAAGAKLGAVAAAIAAALPRTNLGAPRRIESVEFQNEIRVDADGIGRDFTKFITEPNIQSSGAYSEEKTAEYAKWWDEQDENTRNRAIEVLKKMRASNDWRRSNWGSGFMTWVQLKHPEALA